MNSSEQPGAAVVGAIRSIWLEQRDVDLVLQRPKGSARLTFRRGELYLPASHAAAPRLKALLEHARKPTPDKGRQVDAAVGALVDRLVETVMARDLVDWRLDETDRELELVGPLPTAAIVMRGSVRHLDEPQLLERLRGEQTMVQAHGDASLLERLPGLDKSDAFLHSRAEQPVSVEALLKQAFAPRLDALRALCRLEAIDLLRIHDPDRADHEAEVVDEEERNAALVERLKQRVRASIEARPVQVDPNAHYEIVAERVGRLATLNHYELLDLDVHSDEKAVHRAYDRIARLVHPLHARRLGLHPRTLSLVFERATLAYVTLMDSERRAQYNHDAGIERAGSLSDEERSKRRLETARHTYERAQRLAKREEIHFAIELARQAVSIDPQPEYLRLLGRLLARNPQWFDDSIAAYRRAIELAPDDFDIQLEMAERFDEKGDVARVRSICHEVLESEPGNARARGLLAQLGEEGQGGQSPGSGLIDRIRGWMGGESG